ncbi:hypothetical protein MNBD_NITROSPINAE02-20 [hydrothermal vent metagenome]|uniref:CarD-like/TRCF RNAP-interacting domain-containing protein n=1 Tax=hydrothermal vent metagenome TaxID=652676 RepID=A0A3B1CC18_9ZZZZ
MAQQDVMDCFEVGEKIIYPSHGLGVIEKIEEQSSSGMSELCYVIRFENSGMKIMSPIRSAKNVGLRHIIRKQDVPKIIRILQSDETDNIESNWNKRQKIYLEKIKTGSIFEVTSVYRDLFVLKEKKGLSFGEQQVFDNAHRLVVSEIAEAKGILEEKASKLLDKALTR